MVTTRTTKKMTMENSITRCQEEERQSSVLDKRSKTTIQSIGERAPVNNKRKLEDSHGKKKKEKRPRNEEDNRRQRSVDAKPGPSSQESISQPGPSSPVNNKRKWEDSKGKKKKEKRPRNEEDDRGQRSVDAEPGPSSRVSISRPGSSSKDSISRPGSSSKDSTSHPGSSSKDSTSRPGSSSKDSTSRPGSSSNDSISLKTLLFHRLLGEGGFGKESISQPGPSSPVNNKRKREDSKGKKKKEKRPRNEEDDRGQRSVDAEPGPSSRVSISRPGSSSKDSTSRPGSFSKDSISLKTLLFHRLLGEGGFGKGTGLRLSYHCSYGLLSDCLPPPLHPPLFRFTYSRVATLATPPFFSAVSLCSRSSRASRRDPRLSGRRAFAARSVRAVSFKGANGGPLLLAPPSQAVRGVLPRTHLIQSVRGFSYAHSVRRFQPGERPFAANLPNAGRAPFLRALCLIVSRDPCGHFVGYRFWSVTPIKRRL
ncbi:Hypothetical predicted protein [Pelobates cultripes]|uniref:Uncharacterized protein n=1 Tax=Pelobates cultripes TaxID=61616 RepID=A0AAD1TJC9_PELCU|nr:Hypothetical predicted protein [Pelobates cultripes]